MSSFAKPAVAVLCAATLGFGLAACAPEKPSSSVDDPRLKPAKVERAPEFPALELQPRLAAFQGRAKLAESSALKLEKRAELVELFELGEGPGASGRTQSRARRSFAAEEGATRALEFLVTEHKDAALRAIAAFQLSERGAAASVPVLLKRLKYEKDAFARLEVAAALTFYDNLAAVGDIAAIVGDASSPLRQRAGALAIGIRKRYARLLELSAEDAEVESPTWRQLHSACAELDVIWRREGRVRVSAAEVGAKEAELLDARVAQLFVNLESFQLRPVDDARFILLRMGKHSIQDLQTALHAEETYLRNHSLEVVADLGERASACAPQVRALLRNPLSRALACRTLGELRDLESAQWCVELLSSPHPELQAAAAAALGPMGALESKDRLVALANDASAQMDLRVAAASSLAVFELERPWAKWLRDVRDKGDYHTPTLNEILETIDRRLDQQR